MTRPTGAALSILLSFCAPFGTVALAQTPLTLADVRAKVKDARGSLPASERIVRAYSKRGGHGTETTIRSGNDERTDVTSGPFTRAYGEAGGAPWAQNENGETVAGAGGDDDGDVVSAETTFTSLSRPAAASGDYVISEVTKLGFGTKDYVDPATWHIVKHEYVSPTETTTTLYDDFRTTGGYTRAWHTVRSDGHPENDATTTIESIDTTAIPATALAVPADARQLVVFPPNVHSVSLPAQFDPQQGKFIVRVTIGTRGLDFLLDTGASGIVINRAVAQQMGLKEYGAFSSAVNAGRYVGTQTIAPAINIGPLTMTNVEMETIPDIDTGGGDRKIVGLLGFDFIDSVGLKLDYEHGSVTAYDLDSFSVPAAPKMIDVDVRLESYVPETDIEINGAMGTHWIIDSGGAGAVLINDGFRRRYPDAAVDEYRVEHPATLEGVGGNIEAHLVSLASFKLGNVTFKHFLAFVLTDAKYYAGGDDGLVGPDLLRLFTVYIDYQQAHMRLIPNGTASMGISK